MHSVPKRAEAARGGKAKVVGIGPFQRQLPRPWERGGGHTMAVLGCSQSADGSRAITCSRDKTCIVWDLSDGGKQLLKLEGHTSAVIGCSLCADGSRAITCS
eukprot:COSAG02_NODE_21797_length_774_cov_3.040000_2_plen_101_part_01